jgi:hypothetical protein
MSRDAPDPSIEQIEREIRSARFAENDGEKYLGKRAKSKAMRLAVSQFKEKRLQRAYIAGYEKGAYLHPGWYLPAIMGWVLFIYILIDEFIVR